MFAGNLTSSSRYIGVDIGSSAVKMLQLRLCGDRPRVTGAARIEATPSAAAAGDWTPSAAQWHSAFRGGGFLGRRCVVCLPRSDVQVQATRLPRMPEREMRQAVLWEAAHRFNLPRDAIEVDYLPTGASVSGGENREELLLVAASHEAIAARLETLLQAGLRPAAIDTDFAGLARAIAGRFRRASDHTQVRVVVELGASGSSVVILRGSDIAFYKPFAISGRTLNEAVAGHLQIDEAAAAELRRARMAAGDDGSPSTDRAVFEAVRPQLNDLVKEALLCLRYYGVTFRGRPPEWILLAGGDAMEPRLGSLLEQACKIPVVTDDPRGTYGDLMETIGGLVDGDPGPASAWLLAAGLSWRGIPLHGLRTDGGQAEAA